MIYLYHHSYDSVPFSIESRTSQLETLPRRLQEKVHACVHPKAQQSKLFGFLLLKVALLAHGFKTENVNRITYSDKGKPFIPHTFQYNLSHTKKGIVLAVDLNKEIGIDIESSNRIIPERILAKFHPKEQVFFEKISSIRERKETFLSLWVKKEAIIKLAGESIVTALSVFNALEEPVNWKEKNIYSQKVTIDKKFVCYVASEEGVKKVEIKIISSL